MSVVLNFYKKMLRRGFNEGIMEGMSTGREKGIKNIILYLSNRGMSLNEIAENTKFSKEIILSVINK